MKRMLFICLACASIALGLYWQVQLKRANTVQANDDSFQPDFIATRLTSVSFNIDGFRENTLQADYMEHFQSLDMTNFEQPLIFVYPNKGNSKWSLSSTQGTFNTDTQVLSLDNQVMINAIEPNEPIQTVNTQYLELNLNTMIMTSPKSVQIFGPGYQLEGVGLYGDLNANYIDLNKDIIGTYEAQ